MVKMVRGNSAMTEHAISGYQTLVAGEHTFHVFTRGEGEPLLLLHGFPDDLDMWQHVIPRMVGAGYQVIAFDQRGYGDSDAPVGRKYYTIEQIVSDIPLVLDALGIVRPVCLMAHDWGAVIGWCFCMAHPERVRSQVAISVGHPQSYGSAGLQQKLVKGFYTLWFQLPGLAEYMLLHGGMRRWLSGHRQVDNCIERMARPGRLTAALNWYRANFIDILFRRWSRCNTPTLGIWSDGDGFLTESQMTNSRRYMDARWSYQRIDNASHWIPLDKPEELAELAVNWFAAEDR
jgi:pimeloyl-ACP methyl ester carboxylesterase